MKSPAITLFLGFALVGSDAFVRAEEPSVVEESLGLPRWSDQELDMMRRGDGAGAVSSLLWPGGMAGVQGMSPNIIPQDGDPAADSPEAEQPLTDVSKFLPPALTIGKRDRRAAQMALRQQDRVVREVDPHFLLEAEGLPQGQYLMDPSHQLPEVVRDDLSRFLESHARDARVSLYLMVLPADQKLPAQVNLARLAQGSLLREDSCLAVCPLGEPWRLRLFMSSSIRNQLPTTELSQVLDDSMRAAMQTVDSEEQIHRLLIRLSIRLFWLEPSLGTAPPLVETVAKAIPTLPASTALLEVKGSEEARPGLFFGSFYTGAAALVLMTVLGWFAIWRWRKYKLRHYEWLLPEPPPVVPRFDCPHGATVAMIHYR